VEYQKRSDIGDGCNWCYCVNIDTLWLRENLLKEVQKIAKNSELNINSKVIGINTRTKKNS
jgi:hypothetical protein